MFIAEIVNVWIYVPLSDFVWTLKRCVLQCKVSRIIIKCKSASNSIELTKNKQAYASIEKNEKINWIAFGNWKQKIECIDFDSNTLHNFMNHLLV